MGDILSNLVQRLPPAAGGRGTKPRAERAPTSKARRRGSPLTRAVAGAYKCRCRRRDARHSQSELSRHRAPSFRHRAVGVRLSCEGADRDAGPGGCSPILAALLAVRRHRHGDRGIPALDVPRRRRRAYCCQAPAREYSPRACATAVASVSPAGEPGRSGGAPGDLYLITNVSASPLFTRKGDNLEVEVLLSIPARAMRGAEVQGADAQRQQDAARETRHRVRQAPSRPRGEGPPKLGGKGEKGAKARHPPHRSGRSDVPQNPQRRKVGERDRRASQSTLDGDPRAATAGNVAAGFGEPRWEGGRGWLVRRRASRVETDRGVFMILDRGAARHYVHPQTPRVHESRGLIEPQAALPRAPACTSQDDVEQLRRIQEMTGRARPHPRRRRACGLTASSASSRNTQQRIEAIEV